MAWKNQLNTLFAKYPAKCSHELGATQAELKRVECKIGININKLDPVWPDVLQEWNGFKMMDYIFYKTSGATINAIDFKVNFLWEINREWESKVYPFMGIGGVIELGIMTNYLKKPCVVAVKGTGYEDPEVIPISSCLSNFLTCFSAQVADVLHIRRNAQRLPSLSKWPPALEVWYQLDSKLTNRIQQATDSALRKLNPQYGEVVLSVCEKIAKDQKSG